MHVYTKVREANVILIHEKYPVESDTWVIVQTKKGFIEIDKKFCAQFFP